jgi:hypothetical protein
MKTLEFGRDEAVLAETALSLTSYYDATKRILHVKARRFLLVLLFGKIYS